MGSPCRAHAWGVEGSLVGLQPDGAQLLALSLSLWLSLSLSLSLSVSLSISLSFFLSLSLCLYSVFLSRSLSSLSPIAEKFANLSTECKPVERMPFEGRLLAVSLLATRICFRNLVEVLCNGCRSHTPVPYPRGFYCIEHGNMRAYENFYAGLQIQGRRN